MQARKQGSGVVAGILLPMGLVCLFAFCSLALALLGGQAYKGIQAGVDDSYDSTVAASYLRTKLSQSAEDAEISLRDEDGIQVLVIGESYGERLYETRIFWADGVLWESFELAGEPFATGGGMHIAQLSSCAFSLEDDGLFSAELVSMAGSHARTSFWIPEGGAL